MANTSRLPVYGAILLLVSLPLWCGALATTKPMKTVSPRHLNSLIVSQKDLPAGAALEQLDIGIYKVKLGLLEFAPTKSSYDARWSCPLAVPGKKKKTAKLHIDIQLAILDSAKQAQDVVYRTVHSYAEVAPEVTGHPRMRSFADRVWYGDNSYGHARPTSAGVRFARANVAVDIHVSSGDGVDKETLFKIADKVGRRIDAALAGKPCPLPILPRPAR